MATFEKKIDRARDRASRHPRAVGEDGDGMGANPKRFCVDFIKNISRKVATVLKTKDIQKILKSAI